MGAMSGIGALSSLAGGGGGGKGGGASAGGGDIFSGLFGGGGDPLTSMFGNLFGGNQNNQPPPTDPATQLAPPVQTKGSDVSTDPANRPPQQPPAPPLDNTAANLLGLPQRPQGPMGLYAAGDPFSLATKPPSAAPTLDTAGIPLEQDTAAAQQPSAGQVIGPYAAGDVIRYPPSQVLGKAPPEAAGGSTTTGQATPRSPAETPPEPPQGAAPPIQTLGSDVSTDPTSRNVGEPGAVGPTGPAGTPGADGDPATNPNHPANTPGSRIQQPPIGNFIRDIFGLMQGNPTSLGRLAQDFAAMMGGQGFPGGISAAQPYGGAVGANNMPVDAQGNPIPFMSQNMGRSPNGGTLWRTPDGRTVEQPPRQAQRAPPVQTKGSDVSTDPNRPQPSTEPSRPASAEDPSRPAATEDPTRPVSAADPAKTAATANGATPQTGAATPAGAATGPGGITAPTQQDIGRSQIRGSDTRPTAGFSNYLRVQRQPQMQELNQNPRTRLETAAMISFEHENDPVGPVESLMNRANYYHQPISHLLHNGFYGPINEGLLNRRMAELQRNPARLARLNRAIDVAGNGSNLLAGATDQGSGTDRNVHNPSGKIVRFGEVYNDHAPGAAAWRRRQQAEVQRELGIRQPSWQMGQAF